MAAGAPFPASAASGQLLFVACVVRALTPLIAVLNVLLN